MLREILIWTGLVAVAVVLAVAGAQRGSADGGAPFVEGYDPVGFDRLASYDYETPAPGERGDSGQIPSEIRALDGKPVLVRGFVVPLENVRGRVVELYLGRYPLGCCFGKPVAAHELIHVELDNPVPYRPHRPLWLSGRLEVGEEFDAAGYLISVYRLAEAEAVRFDVRPTEHEARAGGILPLPTGSTLGGDPPNSAPGREEGTPLRKTMQGGQLQGG